MISINFFNQEFIDGYFSGTLCIYDTGRRVILDFGYDAEFKQLQLRNCYNILYNSDMQLFEPYEIQNINNDYRSYIITEIQDYLLSQYLYTTPKDAWDA